MGSMWDIAEKQVQDSFSSRKFLIVVILFMLFSVASVYLGAQEYQQQMDQFRDGGIGYVPEEPTLMDVFTPLMSLNMPLAAGLMALLLSYNVISREREEGTIELLLSYPVYRDEVINGKFVGGLFTLSTALLISFGLSTGLAIYMLDLLPTIAQLSRLSFMLIGTVIYMAFFLGIGSLFSTLFRSSWRSLFAGAMIMLISLGLPFGADIAADTIYQYDESSSDPGYLPGPEGAESREVVVEEGDRDVRPPSSQGDNSKEEQKRQEIREKRQRFVEIVSRLSPSRSYSNFVDTMLGINYESTTGLEPTLRESLEAAIGYLVYLISQTALAFTASYAVFLRQDL